MEPQHQQEQLPNTLPDDILVKDDNADPKKQNAWQDDRDAKEILADAANEPLTTLRSLASLAPKKTHGKRGKILGEAAAVPKMSFEVPQTSYGSVLVIPVLQNFESIGDWMGHVMEAYLKLVLTVVLQISMTTWIYGLYLKEVENLVSGAPDCEELNKFLELGCLFLHILAVLTDMCETFDMFIIIKSKIPTCDRTEALEYEDQDGSLVLVHGGMSVVRKVGLMLGVILPKLVVSVLLLIFGGCYLAASASDADLLLNSLAVVFIMELDDMIFAFFTPSRNKHLMAAVPPFDSNEEETGFWKLNSHFGPTFKVLVVIFLVTSLYFGTQRCGDEGFIEHQAKAIAHTSHLTTVTTTSVGR